MSTPVKHSITIIQGTTQHVPLVRQYVEYAVKSMDCGGGYVDACTGAPVPPGDLRDEDYTGPPGPVGAGDALEIDDQHHVPLLYCAKHLAYDTHDAEIFDRHKADDYEVKFRAYCAQARVEQTRARRQVGSTQYGGL